MRECLTNHIGPGHPVLDESKINMDGKWWPGGGRRPLQLPVGETHLQDHFPLYKVSYAYFDLCFQ